MIYVVIINYGRYIKLKIQKLPNMLGVDNQQIRKYENFLNIINIIKNAWVLQNWKRGSCRVRWGWAYGGFSLPPSHPKFRVKKTEQKETIHSLFISPSGLKIPTESLSLTRLLTLTFIWQPGVSKQKNYFGDLIKLHFTYYDYVRCVRCY